MHLFILRFPFSVFVLNEAFSTKKVALKNGEILLAIGKISLKSFESVKSITLFFNTLLSKKYFKKKKKKKIRNFYRN